MTQQPYHPDPEYYSDRAEGLLASARDGTPSAAAAFAGLPLDGDGARRAVAAAHGCADWEALMTCVASLDEPFARAYRAVEAHDPDALAAELDAHPEVARQEGTNGNDLLAMATGTCDERTVGLLLDRGADPRHANAHGWTSLHQVAYSNSVHLVDLLLTAGADPTLSGRGDGGTPFVVAAFWGNTAVMAELEVFPLNLRACASAGEPDRVEGDPGAHRAYYRPHSGFPSWTPSDDPQEVLDEALSWAARCDRADAVRALAERGANLEADVYRGTALTWAGATGATAAVAALLELGADPDTRGTFGGPTHGEGVMAIHIAAQSGQAEVVDLLLAAGADSTSRDGHDYGPPAGWAANGGHPEIAERIRLAD